MSSLDNMFFQNSTIDFFPQGLVPKFYTPEEEIDWKLFLPTIVIEY